MAEFSFWGMFVQASMLVQVVMVVLGLASLVSWAVIFNKSRVMRIQEAELRVFDENFWQGVELTSLYEKLRANDTRTIPEETFVIGFRAYAQLARSNQLSAEAISHTSVRKMKVLLVQQAEFLDRHLPMLATIGSVSPYIGLFGTVWGIINAFHSLDPTHGASMLATIAPGISEALIATALGLFAAIPAVIGYNYFVERADRLMMQYDTFVEEFTALLQRETLTRSGSS